MHSQNTPNDHPSSMSNKANVIEDRKVLIIDANEDIIDLLEIHLTDLSCKVSKVFTGLEGFDLAQKEKFDLIIINDRLPDIDGREICHRLQEAKNDSLILMLLAKPEKFYSLKKVTFKANAYLTKPFRVGEFVGKVKELFINLPVS